MRRKDHSRKPQMDTSNGFSSSTATSMIKSCVDKKAKKQIIKEAEMEFKLRGKFKRVFPSIDYHYYKQFFTEERSLNIILDEKLMAKRRLGNNMQPSLMIASGQMGLLQGNHMPMIMNNQQLPNILPPLHQHIQIKSKMEQQHQLAKTKSQLVDNSKTLVKRAGGSSHSASSIQHQQPPVHIDRSPFIIIEAQNEKSDT